MTNLFGDPEMPMPETGNKNQLFVTVPWYGMTYEMATKANLVQAIKDHLHFELTPEQSNDYLKYLKNIVGFPSNFYRLSDDLG